MKVDRFPRRCESSSCTRRRGLWRSWLDAPRGHSLDGRWYCSSECFEQALASAIRQSLPVSARPPAKAHRVPLGLLMLSRGLVDDEQLKRALKAQKDSGSGRVGEWLRHIGAVTEEQVTQILGLQWSIPVFPLSQSLHPRSGCHARFGFNLYPSEAPIRCGPPGIGLQRNRGTEPQVCAPRVHSNSTPRVTRPFLLPMDKLTQYA